MGGICSNCGNQLKEGARFCNKCGKPVADEPPKVQVPNNVQEVPVVQEAPVTVEEKKSSGSTLSTALKVIVGLAVVFFAASALFGKSEDKGAKQEAASASVKQEQSASTGSQQKSISTDSAESALASFGIKGKINNSTFGNNSDGFMANVDNKIYVVDLKNKQIASVENYSFVANELNKNRSGDSNSGVIIPQFLIFNDRHGKDDDLGEWRGDNHFLPIYILIKHDSAGNVKVDGDMSSGQGAAPSHYQGYLKEQKNIDIANVFMKQIVPFMGPLAPVVSKEANSNTLGNGFVGSKGIINGDEVNVRQGPSKDYKSLGFFYKGDIVKIVDRTVNSVGEQWCKVEYNNPSAGLITGWTRADFINPQDTNISNSTQSSQNPQRVFLEFHKSITERRLRDAYNILSPDYQRFVGGYDKFVPGYNTTISSEIVELQRLDENAYSATFKYKLKAVDREGSGMKTRLFYGKARLIKIDGVWRIDSTEAKLL